MGVEDSAKVSAWLGVATSIVGLLAFLGITNIDQVGEKLGVGDSSASPSASPSPSLTSHSPPPPISFNPWPSPEPVKTPDRGCEAAISTMESYTGLINANVQGEAAQKAVAVTLNRQAADLEADVSAAQTPKVRAAIKGLAAASRAQAAALPNNSPADLARWRAAADKFSAELAALGEGCSVLV
ncbi:hypothetical protein KCMC57_up57700 [Kitasatospora sp. CMC57]|uniref:Uncharacterized protein n=1 Tax=Kitasatospora sp. CMC57 TaxID=3231513 RepID=A0AB33K7E3_9ACTN